MFVPTYGPATHAGHRYQDDGPLSAAPGYEELGIARGGTKVERSLKASRIATITLLSINIEITRRATRPKSETERLEAAHRRNQLDRQLDRAAEVARARLLIGG